MKSFLALVVVAVGCGAMAAELPTLAGPAMGTTYRVTFGGIPPGLSQYCLARPLRTEDGFSLSQPAAWCLACHQKVGQASACLGLPLDPWLARRIVTSPQPLAVMSHFGRATLFHSPAQRRWSRSSHPFVAIRRMPSEPGPVDPSRSVPCLPWGVVCTSTTRIGWFGRFSPVQDFPIRH
jgi:hypothetical protein